MKYKAVGMFCVYYVRFILKLDTTYVLRSNKLITIMKMNSTYNKFEKLRYKT